MPSSLRLSCPPLRQLSALLASSLLLSACGGVGDDLFNSGSASGTGGATSTTASSGSGASTSTSSNGSSMPTSGSSSSGMPGAEDCLDGMDNNGDGLVDCADPQCVPGYQCVDAPPPGGFKEYLYVTQTQLPAGPPAACPPDLQQTSEFINPEGPPQCTACTCGPMQGGSCSAPGISCWPGSTTCSNVPAQDWTPMLQDGQCHKPPVFGAALALSCQITKPSAVVMPGTCMASTSDFPNKSPFQARLDACGTDKKGGGCGGTQVCVPKGPGAPGERLCVRQQGMNACPPGPWGKPITAYDSANDTRACGACACGAGKAACTDGSYTFYDVDQCMMGGDNPIPVNSNACTNVSSLLDGGTYSVNGQLPQLMGSCAATGGAPGGSVQPQNAVTYCCQ